MAQPKEKTPDTTIRNLFLRVSSTNNSSSGVVTYSLDEIKKAVTDFTDRYTGTQYAFIAHDKDTSPDGAVALHFHVFMKFVKPVKFKYIKAVFPHGNIDNARSANACVQYLIHKNNPEKHQYDKSEIITNIDADKFEAFFINDKKVSKRKEGDELDEILEQIANGTIRRFNFNEYIDIHIYSKYKTRIENAFIYREKEIMKDKNRQISVWFVSGAAGSGKTTIAKRFAERNGIGACISSSSNDPLQDYMGEDTLILDDLRDDVFTFTDLLKILDNHTQSTIKSRYSNKAFLGKQIIITSYKPLNTWYLSVPKDARKQLYRRISCLVIVHENELELYNHDSEGKISLEYTMENPVKLLIENQKPKPQNTLQLAVDFANAFENDLTPEQNKTLEKSITLCSDDSLPF